MLNHEGFDLWADTYDRSTACSDENGSYPFAGYGAVLRNILRRVLVHGAGDVLDIGFGTGVLTASLYQQGCHIWGQDFLKNGGTGTGKNAVSRALLRRFYGWSG